MYFIKRSTRQFFTIAIKSKMKNSLPSENLIKNSLPPIVPTYKTMSTMF
jgi:hypothetical protein